MQFLALPPRDSSADQSRRQNDIVGPPQNDTETLSLFASGKLAIPDIIEEGLIRWFQVAKKSKSNSPYKRIVVKLGTSLVTGGSDCLNQDILSALVRQTAQLHQKGLELLIVSG